MAVAHRASQPSIRHLLLLLYTTGIICAPAAAVRISLTVGLGCDGSMVQRAASEQVGRASGLSKWGGLLLVQHGEPAGQHPPTCIHQWGPLIRGVAPCHLRGVAGVPTCLHPKYPRPPNPTVRQKGCPAKPYSCPPTQSPAAAMMAPASG
jgi:hypothetical protein